jgi:hypothetical protein
MTMMDSRFPLFWRLFLVGLVALAASPALAQGRGKGSASDAGSSAANDPLVASLANWDFNHDSVFTCANWKRYMTQLFNEADRKKRGFIGAEEFETIKAADPMFSGSDFDYFDEAHKGRITKSDFVDRPSQFFLRYDKKHSCRVTMADINAPAVAPVQQPRGRSGGGRKGF